MCPQAREVLCSPGSGSGSGPRGAEIESLPLAGAPVLSSRYAIHFKLNIAGRIEFSKKRIRTRIVYYRTGVDRVRVFGIGIDRSSESERHIHSFSFLFLLLLLLLLRHYVSTNDWHARTHAHHWQPEDGRKSYCQCVVCTYTVYRVTVHGVQPDVRARQP